MRGHHHGHRTVATRRLASFVLIGDSIHTRWTGVADRCRFPLTSFPLGLVTTFAVAAHEIPHRVGGLRDPRHSGLSASPRLFSEHGDRSCLRLSGIASYFGLQMAIGTHALCGSRWAAAGFLYIAVAASFRGCTAVPTHAPASHR